MAGKVEPYTQEQAREIVLAVLNLLLNADMPEGSDAKIDASFTCNNWIVEASRAAEGGYHIHLRYA